MIDNLYVIITIIIVCALIVKLVLILLYNSKCNLIKCGKLEIHRDVKVEQKITETRLEIPRIMNGEIKPEIV